MNNKGFAITSLIYSSIILLTVIMFTVLAIESTNYKNEKDYVEDVNQNLSDCLKRGDCE